MSGWLAIPVLDVDLILARRGFSPAAPGEEVDAFRARSALREMFSSHWAMRVLRQRGRQIGLPDWSARASDEELEELILDRLEGGALVLKEVPEEQPDPVGEADYVPTAMRGDHIQAFKEAARHFDVYILVRETNLASLQHIGQGYAVAKPLDCKAKTADFDFLDSTGLNKVAGLVVDPNIIKDSAFKPGKHAKALRIWNDEGWGRRMIAPEVATLEAQRSRTWLTNGRYFVDMDPESDRYGAVKFTPTGLMSAAKYLHGDFDLYAIVPAKDPSRNIKVSEKRLGEDHDRSPEFFDVQTFLNRRLGVPMVLHGAEESYEDEFSDDSIDIFHPSGKISCVQGRSALARLYETLFKGRKLFTANGQVEVVQGDYVTPA